MDDLIKQGAAAAKAGDIDTARRLLVQAVKQSPDDEKAWGWLYNVCKNDQERIDCLTQIIRINPENQKAQEFLGNLKNEKNGSAINEKKTEDNLIKPTSLNSTHSNSIKKSFTESTIGEKKLIFALVGIVLLLICVISIAGVTSWVNQIQMKNAQATAESQALSARVTATAEFLQCSEQFEQEFTRLLSQFFRQQSIADVTSRINLPEQVARLEDIRTETWNMPQKSCQTKAHSYLITIPSPITGSKPAGKPGE